MSIRILRQVGLVGLLLLLFLLFLLLLLVLYRCHIILLVFQSNMFYFSKRFHFVAVCLKKQFRHLSFLPLTLKHVGNIGVVRSG